VTTLEARVSLEEKEKRNLESQLSELRADYENYKIRATSVFKKQKTEAQVPSTHEPTNEFNTDKVECEMLQRLVDALKLKISELEYVIARTVHSVTIQDLLVLDRVYMIGNYSGCVF